MPGPFFCFGGSSELDYLQSRNKPKVAKVDCSNRVAVLERCSSDEEVDGWNTDPFGRAFSVNLSGEQGGLSCIWHHLYVGEKVGDELLTPLADGGHLGSPDGMGQLG